MFRQSKYLLAYSIPLITFVAVHSGGWWSFATVLEAFFLVPIIEAFLPKSERNVPKEDEASLLSMRFFDYMLYLIVPVHYAILGYFLYRISFTDLETFEMIGMMLSMGVQSGSIGINVAHELGHRKSKFERFLAKALLLSSLYMHFIVEHNRGHHKHVATPNDPATARFGEPIYLFWPRTLIGSFRSAWRIERKRVSKLGKPTIGFYNDMVLYITIQLALIFSIALVFQPIAILGFLVSSLVGMLLLETVNYIEHYGLMRKETAPGRYERVQPWHSWNSDYTLGRILLFELTRHSDHHYLASRKYQVLRHMPESPQLPTGYPGAMMISLIPPLWFRMVNPRVVAQREKQKALETA